MERELDPTTDQGYATGYSDGYADGHARGVAYATRMLEAEFAQLKADLAWALFQIESPDVPRSIIDEVARLRAAWRLVANVEAKERTYYAPGGDAETD